MLLQMLIQNPRMIGPVLHATPPWVWGILAVLLGLGFSQARARSASLRRVAFMPVALGVFALWGLASAFGRSPMFGYVMLLWMLCASTVFAAVASMAPPAGASWDDAARRFHLRGSWTPMLLIAGIFVVKYFVGVDVAMQPSLARDANYTLAVGAIYGAFSGIFAGRAARLFRLTGYGLPGLRARRDAW